MLNTQECFEKMYRIKNACAILVFSSFIQRAIGWQGSFGSFHSRLVKHATSVRSLRRLESSSSDLEHTERIDPLIFEQQPELERLKEENQRLREALDRVETENVRLQQTLDNRIILEVFEGESRMKRDLASTGESVTLTAENMLAEEHYLERTEECSLDDPDSCPIEPQIPFGEALRDRAFWLVGLLAMQSCSGFILANNEALLGNHPISKYYGS